MEDEVAELPIDIHVGKLVEWLVSRKHAGREWAQDVHAIRRDIAAAIQDMPEHEDITELLAGTHINYFHCLQIVEILKETEADSKNMLGWYTSTRMKDWVGVVKQYERHGAGLAESGQLLYRYVTHEMPAIRAQAARCQATQQECDKKEEDITKATVNARNAYQRKVKDIGIPGENVREELLSLVRHLPEQLDEVSRGFTALSAAVTCYERFTAFTTGRGGVNKFPLLKYLIEHGNVTTYEHKHGRAPVEREDPFEEFRSKIIERQEDKEEGGIDFGDDDEGIDFGGDDGGEVDFGDDGVDYGITAADDIDFGEEEVEKEVKSEDGVARGKEARSLLHNPDTRDLLLDSLYELESFLQQSLANVAAGRGDHLDLFAEAPRDVAQMNESSLTVQLSSVRSVLQSLDSPAMTQLFLISDSLQYVEQLVASLARLEAKAKPPVARLEALQEARVEARATEGQLGATLASLQRASRKLKGQLERAVSRKYQGRPVNLLGAKG